MIELEPTQFGEDVSGFDDETLVEIQQKLSQEPLDLPKPETEEHNGQF